MKSKEGLSKDKDVSIKGPSQHLKTRMCPLRDHLKTRMCPLTLGVTTGQNFARMISAKGFPVDIGKTVGNFFYVTSTSHGKKWYHWKVESLFILNHIYS